MKTVYLLALAFTVCCPISSLAKDDQAPPTNTLTDKEKSDGWRVLFDGQSIDQWRRFNGQAIGDKWKAKDGTLALTGGGGGDIITKEQFDSFELVLEYNISAGGNSGVMFHLQEGDSQPG